MKVKDSSYRNKLYLNCTIQYLHNLFSTYILTARLKGYFFIDYNVSKTKVLTCYVF